MIYTLCFFDTYDRATKVIYSLTFYKTGLRGKADNL